MTNQEAITKLTNIMHDDHYAWHPSVLEAFRMAVDALRGLPSTQPSFPQAHENDCISRADAIDAMEESKKKYFDRRVIIGKMQDIVNNLPSVQPEILACGNGELNAQPEPCDDPRADVYYLAEKIGIHQLYALVVELRGEPEQRWIPVTERLPEDEKKHYWICTDTGYQCECRWTNINHLWTDLTTNWHWHIMDIPQYSAVIAWMPLPEPWKEGEADEVD